MDQEQFLTYQKFSNAEDLNELSELLNANSIAFEVEDASARVDGTFVSASANKEYRLKLKQEDFARADQLQNEIAANDILTVEADHYLYSFSDAELIDLVEKSDEWSKFDLALAKKILSERGVGINVAKLEEIQSDRLKELAKPEKASQAMVVTGYISAILGGLLGVFLGWHLLNHKRTLPNGTQVYGYTEADRMHGNRILILGVVFFTVGLVVKLIF